MKRAFFGIIGLVFGIIAVLIGVFAFSEISHFMAGIYLLLSVIFGIIVIRVFCASCPIKNNCVHIIPGYIAKQWNEKPGSYGKGKLFITGISFAIIILIPQGILITSPLLLCIFWVCIGIAALTSYCFLCPDCGNRFCPFRREV